MYIHQKDDERSYIPKIVCPCKLVRRIPRYSEQVGTSEVNNQTISTRTKSLNREIIKTKQQ